MPPLIRIPNSLVYGDYTIWSISFCTAAPGTSSAVPWNRQIRQPPPRRGCRFPIIGYWNKSSQHSSASGMTVANEAHALWSDGLRYFGLLEVTNGQTHEDYGLVIGLRNSHDKSFPAAIAMGSAFFAATTSRFRPR